jgi:L-alanine-DL-glutamate epimerase-like enolase superfamily enzyme
VKIVSVEALALAGSGAQGAYGAPYGALVRIATDTGVIGYGETDSLPAMVKAVVEADYHDEMMSGLAALLIGEDPRHTDHLWQRMADGTANIGRDGLTVAAMAAVDLALWDIRGKAEARPVFEIFGGARRMALPYYASHPLGATLDETAAFARALREKGVPAAKFGWTPFGRGSAAEDEAIVQTLRRELGDDIALLIDGGIAFDAETAIERSRMLADYGVHWFEEPLRPYDVEGYRKLRANAAVPIAAGEMAMTYDELARLIDNDGVDVLQVDISRVGLTQAMRVADHAAAQGVACVNHTYSLDWNLAASLHFCAALDKTDLFEVQLGANELRDNLVSRRPRIADGVIHVPDGPGLGVEPDPDALARFLVA